MNPIIRFIQVFRDNYVWLLIAQNKRDCIIVDPGDALPVLDYLKKHDLNPVAILITHHHVDHMGGVPDLLLHYVDLPVYGSSKASAPFINRLVQADDVITFSSPDIIFQVLDLPGHAIGHVAYYAAKPGVVFTGDVLFTGGCGGVFEGTYEQMFQSLMQLRNLPDETLVYCGHEYTLPCLQFALKIEPDNEALLKRLIADREKRRQGLPTVPSTIALEKATNPFLRCDASSVVEAVYQHAGQRYHDPIKVFEVLRNWKSLY